jgi:selenium-binding protein 1
VLEYFISANCPKENKMKITKNFKFVLILALILAAGTAVQASAKGFEHGPLIVIDGENYYMDGVPDADGGITDIPGHYWVQAGPRQVVGKHYNTGPFGKPSWWSSDAPNGSLLFTIHGIIDTWSKEKAEMYAARGYTHYHEFVKADGVDAGSEHPTKVVWLKHTAVDSFNFDGGPMPQFGHEVTPGVDYEFMPNGMKPYPPTE